MGDPNTHGPEGPPFLVLSSDSNQEQGQSLPSLAGFLFFSEPPRPAMGMMHPTSSKQGYEPHYVASSYAFEEEHLRRILVKETQWRMSTPFQRLYSDPTVPDDSYLQHLKEVTEHLQREILIQEGVAEADLRPAMAALHNVRVTHPHLLPLTVYGRYDVSCRGALREGDQLPDANLCALDGTPQSLHSFLQPGRPLVIMGVSVS